MVNGFGGSLKRVEPVSSVRIIGGDKVKAELKNYAGKLKKEVSGAIEDGAKVFVRLAKRDAPVRKTPIIGNGTYGSNLKQLISYGPNVRGLLAYEVVSGAHYSPYLEWGTVTKVSVPSELADYAIQFKGRGIIKTGGIVPQPFFFKQMPIVQQQIISDLKQILG